MALAQDPINALTLIFCPHCLELADHFRPNCPYLKSKQAICGKCAQTGHKPTLCTNPVKCHHCGVCMWHVCCVYAYIYELSNVCKCVHASMYVYNPTYTTLTIYSGRTNRASKLKFTGDTVKLISNTR